MFTSYKIAHYLRSSFKEIKAFVPYQAASGGTLICCGANEIYLGDLGNLTPIDPQVRYKETRVSAQAFERIVDGMKTLYGEYSPTEVPTPWQQMADKIDPVIFDEMQTLMFTTFAYALRLLDATKYEHSKAVGIAYRLSRTQNNHSHPILRSEAVEIGFNIKEDKEQIKT